MVRVDEKDHEMLRFLWINELDSDVLKPLILRFTCVVFGVSSSPFLLNATINHHIKSYRDIDPFFVDKFLSSIYVDDVSLGSPDVESMFQLYQKSKEWLVEAGFKLRKFITNSDEMQQFITLTVRPPTPLQMINPMLRSLLDQSKEVHQDIPRSYVFNRTSLMTSLYLTSVMLLAT